MFTDIVGFSRQMGADESRTMRRLAVHNQIIQQAVATHHGTTIKTVGDAFLVDFPSVVHAVQCAQQLQSQFKGYNSEQAPTEQIHVRVGIHSGDIIQKDGDVFGDGVNIAARLQALAEPDTICISDIVYRDVTKKLDLGTVVSLGRPQLKNITERFQVYALLPTPPKGLRQTLQVQRLKFSRRVGTAHRVVATLLLLAGAVVAVRHFPPSLPSTQPLAPSPQAAPTALPLPDKPSIVVLPFTNMSGDPGQEYFSDGITEDITTDLSKVSSLFVIARNSAFSYKGKSPKVQEVSREMGVRYVLEGSVRKSDNQIRITAQLIDATTGGHLWSERYDRFLQDIFALQDEIRQKIVFALKVKLTPEEQERFKSFPTGNLDAYDYLLRGRESFFRLTKEANAQAQQMYDKAIELDPQYAAAYAALGSSHFLDWAFQWSQNPPQTLEHAFTLAQKAVALDDSLPYAHSELGREDEARAEAAEARRISPQNSLEHFRQMLSYTDQGESERFLAALRKAGFK